MADNLWDLDFSSWGGEDKNQDSEEQAMQATTSHRRKTALLEISQKYEYRRAFSEMKLLDLCGEFKFTEGHSYNFLTGGDIDSLSFLKCILRQQDLEHCLAATWCLAGRGHSPDRRVGERWQNKASGHVCRRDFSDKLHNRMVDAQGHVRQASGAWQICGIPQSREDLCGDWRTIRFRHSVEREHQHKSSN